MRGPPSVAGRDRVKGQGNAALGKGTSRTVRSNLERGYRDKSPPVERRKASGLRKKAARPPALHSLTHVREGKKGRRWPRAGWEGDDESRLYGCLDGTRKRELF